MADPLQQMLAHVTGGRRYCFMIMTFNADFLFFERIRTIVAEQTGFECIRADHICGVSDDLRRKVHAAIEAAALVIADVSHPSPNIFYEVGYAVARGKPLLLLARDDLADVPTDLRGVELIRYRNTQEGWL